MDRLTSLRVFVRVADNAGFATAARQLRMSTTMVSNHVQALEEQLGVRLLNRTTRKVALTEVGRVYHERCTQILAELDEADQAASAQQATPRGTLRVYVGGTHITPFISPAVVEYLARYPDTSVDLAVGARMIDLVEEGFELALIATPPPDSTLIVRRLAPWRHFLCAAPSYLERHTAPERPEDLVHHNCLRYAHYPFGNEWRLVGPGGEPVAVRVRGRLVTSSAETLRTVALAGEGILLAPSFASYIFGDDLGAGRLVRILEDYTGVEFAIHAIYPHRHHLSTKVRAFLDLVAERLGGPQSWSAPRVAGR
jgi:DNA-binding transcriptional LysR family regulator